MNDGITLRDLWISAIFDPFIRELLIERLSAKKIRTRLTLIERMRADDIECVWRYKLEDFGAILNGSNDPCRDIVERIATTAAESIAGTFDAFVVDLKSTHTRFDLNRLVFVVIGRAIR